MFEHSMIFNSSMVGENFETLGYEIPKNAMKSHEQFMFEHSMISNSTMVGENFETWVWNP